MKEILWWIPKFQILIAFSLTSHRVQSVCRTLLLSLFWNQSTPAAILGEKHWKHLLRKWICCTVLISWESDECKLFQESSSFAITASSFSKKFLTLWSGIKSFFILLYFCKVIFVHLCISYITYTHKQKKNQKPKTNKSFFLPYFRRKSGILDLLPSVCLYTQNLLVFLYALPIIGMEYWSFEGFLIYLISISWRA